MLASLRSDQREEAAGQQPPTDTALGGSLSASSLANRYGASEAKVRQHMSIRDQEHRTREAMRRAEQKKKNRREDREAFGQTNEARLRTEEVKRRIEVATPSRILCLA